MAGNIRYLRIVALRNRENAFGKKPYWSDPRSLFYLRLSFCVCFFLFGPGQPSKFLELFIPRHYRGGRGSTGEPEGRT